MQIWAELSLSPNSTCSNSDITIYDHVIVAQLSGNFKSNARLN